MADERNRPQTGKPDTATLIQRLFRDEPEEPPPAGEAPQTVPEAGSSVGVVTPPDQAGAEAGGSGAATAEAPVEGAPATAEGVVELPPSTDEGAAAARDGRSWFVIHTYSGYENKVRTNLE